MKNSSVFLGFAALAVFAVVNFAVAATTISTDISTDGSLTVNSTSATSSIAFGTTLASSGGFVGVGFTTPLSLLNIKGSNPVFTVTDSRNQSFTVGDQFAAIDFASDDTSSGGYTGKVRARIAALELDTFGASQGLTFYTTRITNGLLEEKVRIDQNGAVSIGTTSPYASPNNTTRALTVLGSGGGSGAAGVIQLATGEIASTNGNNVGVIEWHNTAADSANTRSSYILSALSGTTGANIGSYLAFGTEADGASGTGSERMRITNAGNLGIGTTTAATRLHVSNGASATTTVSIGELGLTSSKGCVNMNRADGGAGSFFISAAGTLVVETNYCR